MGGIDTDVNGATVMPGLYAAGECACVSVHGANRLGGNSLLETIVFGRRAGAEVARYLEGLADKRPNARSAFAAVQMMEDKVEELGAKTGTEDAYALRTEMTEIMKEHYGLFRDAATMKEGLEKLVSIKERVGDIGLRWTGSVFNIDMIRTVELEGMVDLALAVGLGALARTESRGAHYRTDHNTRDDVNWLKHTMAQYQPDAPGPRLGFKPVTLGPFELQERKY
jgi:succinate dehydrogenase / fumarate reductase flavoprotein subunit